MSKVILTLLALMFSLSCAAAEEHFTQLKVEVHNYTRHTCIFQEHKLNHGYIVTFLKDEILPGGGDSFIVSRYSRGIDLHLSYRCGDQYLKFQTLEDWNFAYKREVTSNILEHDEFIIASMGDVIIGNWLSDTMSTTSWEIHELA